MRLSRPVLLSLLALLFTFNVAPAQAFDIPLLTWERGKEQNLVLGGNTDNEWRIELVDEANESVLEFTASEISANGFVVYSAYIPPDFPIGAYAVKATGLGIPSSIVAGVNIVALSFYEVVQIPFELLWIFLGYIFVTATLGALRLRRYGVISVQGQETFDPDLVPQALSTLYRLRESTTRNIDPSLFQVVLRREGGWLRERSVTLWSTIPLIGLILGFVLGVEILRAGGLGNAPWILLFFGAVISLFDLYSGIMAFAGMVLSHLIFGDVVSLRDVMTLLAVALGWSGAYAIGTTISLLQEKHVDLSDKESRRIISAILSGAAAAIVFHSSQILILSLVVTVSAPAPVSWFLSALVGVAVVGKCLLRPALESEARLRGRTEISIGRAISPKTVTFLAAFFAGTLYIWIRDWISAIALGLALTAPYAMLLVRFSSPRLALLGKLRREPLIEALLVSGVGYLIFYLLEDLPFEVLEQSRLFLILGVIPVLIHALFSMLWDVQDRGREVATSESLDQVEKGVKL